MHSVESGYARTAQEMRLEYNWQRRWIPVYEGGADSTGATRGTTVVFDEIHHIPCLVLLGEPGMGKIEFVQR